MPRGRRLISPGAAGGLALLGLFLAVVLGSTVHTVHNSVAGLALPAEEPAPTIGKRGATAPTPEAPPAPANPGTPNPPAAAPPPAAEAPAAPGTRGAPAPAAKHKPGTVRLARGGTATLVRREVGIDGVLPIPSSLLQATWWGAGLDATTGATVLAGHVNWRGATGPFAELWKAKVGDPVLIVNQAGTPTNYRVTQVVTLHKDELPARAEELFAQDGPHRLVLVTCGGQWVGGEAGYASNQIVIATRA